MGAVIRLLAITGIGLAAAFSQAGELSEAVSIVARTHQTTQATTQGHAAYVIYVGQFNDCEAVSARSNGHDQHFRICGNNVIDRHSVAPTWPEGPGNKRVLAAVVQNAILYGQNSQSDNDGYLIQARALGAVGSSCKNLEVLISFDGDLVDHALKNVCE
ncbi:MULTISPECIES: hypothetical protein [Chromobacterium]|uniref:hypothetical protein n=1 Tax=Chromobacterium TaxID=535 RepID=UPI001886C28C|nr:MULTISPECIES: hypothetical protein [Chromobacterium]QOZ83768.1 hypothetical protein DXT74_12275 [Chromobacterium sp. Rain0013]WON83902.1 hypothetical protein OK026_22820 [Chromobacterium haemolyticum]